jgi:hypothetical protein
MIHSPLFWRFVDLDRARDEMVPENIAVGTLFEMVSFPHQGGQMQGASAVRTVFPGHSCL